MSTPRGAAKMAMIPRRRKKEPDELPYASTFFSSIYTKLRVIRKKTEEPILKIDDDRWLRRVYGTVEPRKAAPNREYTVPEPAEPKERDDDAQSLAWSAPEVKSTPITLEADTEGGHALFFDYQRPLIRRNVPGLLESLKVTMMIRDSCAFDKPVDTFYEETKPGPSIHRTAHKVDEHHLRPDFIHATASNNLLAIVERSDQDSWKIFSTECMAWFSVPRPKETEDDRGLSIPEFVLTSTVLLDDCTLLLWRKGDSRVLFMQSPNNYFSDIHQELVTLKIAVSWIVSDKRRVYFGGQELDDRQWTGSARSLPPSRNAPFSIYCAQIDCNYNRRGLRLLWTSRGESAETRSSSRTTTSATTPRDPKTQAQTPTQVQPAIHISVPYNPFPVRRVNRRRSWPCTKGARHRETDAPAVWSRRPSVELGDSVYGSVVSLKPGSDRLRVTVDDDSRTPLNKWHNTFVWFDGVQIRFILPLFGCDANSSMIGKVSMQSFSVRKCILSSITTSSYKGPPSFWSSEPSSSTASSEPFREFRGCSNTVIRVRGSIDNVWLFDVDRMAVRRVVIRAPWLGRSPLYVNINAITPDGHLLLYLSNELGGSRVRRRGLLKPTERSVDTVAIVSMFGVSRLEDLARYRILDGIPRRDRFQLLSRRITTVKELLHYYGKKPYKG